MDQTQNQAQRSAPTVAPASASSSASRAYQFHPARAAIVDLFNLYLGRSSRQKPEDSIREPPNKTQKRVLALNRELPPRNEQFLLDFEQLQSQFSDQEQLRAVTESILISLVVQCSGHAPRAEFLLFALRSLCSIGYINWDTLLPSLLSSISSAEMTMGQGSQVMPAVSSTSLSQSGMLPPSSSIPNSSNFQSSNPASPLPSVHGIGSPAQSTTEPPSCATLSPAKSSDISCNGQQSTARVNSSIRDNAVSSLRQLCCKIILAGLEFNLKPVTHAEIFYHMLNWLVNWDQRQQGIDESDAVKSWRPDKALIEWLHSCLDVIWLLVEEDKCRVPFYELLRSGVQFIENIPDDEALFTLILEIHRRRDMMAMHMQMLDQHLHCPTFGTHRILSQTAPNIAGEAVANMRYSPITYPSVLGEPLHGEDLAMSIQKGSLDWERALRCIRHALRTTPSPDWWKRVLLVAPSYKSPQPPTPGAVFTSEMICEATIDRIIELLKLTNSGNHLFLNFLIIELYSKLKCQFTFPLLTLIEGVCKINCWQEWLILSDIFFFLTKSGCIDFVDFVDKLLSRVTEGDPHILKTNHVTLLLAQVIRAELVMNALNSDPRKVETTRKLISFHREERSPDPNNPQSILLDFISSCQNLRIWSLNTATRDYLNNEQLQKGKQIDEWWRQASKGDRIMDYMNMDDRSVGMFWVVSYTMAQPACETVMNWLNSAGVTELLPGPNLQSNERVMVMREVSPLPMSLLSGFSMNLCLKLAFQMEESLFAGQVVPSIAMVETYTRLLLISPHSLFRSHFSINLLERQELQQRVKLYCINRGPPEHWLHSGMFKRVELQKALGNHLSWKDRYPTFFDDVAARLLPVIPLIVYRLIENDAMDPADRLLAMYSPFLAYHPLKFTFVRDILAYFYGHLPAKLILRILKVLDLSKIPFSESFPQHITSANPVCPPMDYFATLLLGLVNNVIPPLHNNSKSGSMGEHLSNSVRAPLNKTPATSQSGLGNASEGQKAFYQIQDPGTYTNWSLKQLNGLHGASNGVGQASVLPTSPSGGSTDSLSAGRSTTSVSGINTSNIVSRSGYTCQQLSCLLIQACGLLLAQLPPDFHMQLYIETSRIIKESWWLTDGKRSLGELDSAVGYALLDPSWAAQDNTSTAIGNIVALLHSFSEWLEGTHVIIKHLRPVTSVAMLRIAFRIMGPLLPRLANAHTLFNKVQKVTNSFLLLI
ncbi:mediator of rna polymerase ii transcription subunit 23 [Quercus suber]|uniref:Mediator of rna polymerase ii transcription subunit 23 n=1 Tax=Quercus suber TaxID=58331 RepID=A0AAW0KCM1_QUESU